MHRLKSPLVALIALLVLVGPLFGRVSQIDPNDPFQISTPTAYERSRQETIPVAEPVHRFSHDQNSDGSGPYRHYTVGDDILLSSLTTVEYIQRSTLTEVWEHQSSFEIVSINVLSSDTKQRIMLSGESTCTFLDAVDGSTVWENQDCPSGNFSLLEDGSLRHHYSANEERVLRRLDMETGEEQWSYSYLPNINQASHSSTATSPDNRVYYVATLDSIQAISLESGEVLWSTPLVAEQGIILLDSHLLVLRNSEIIAIDASSGAEVWFSFMEPGYNTQAGWGQPETGEKLLIAVGSAITVLDVTTGLEITRYDDANVVATRYSDAEGQTVFPEAFMLRVGSDAVGINWETLNQNWIVTNAGSPSSYGNYNEIQLMTTSDGRTLVIDIHTGKSLRIVDSTDISSANNGSVILFRHDQRIEAYDTVNKQRLWVYNTSGEIRRWTNNSEFVTLTTRYEVDLVNVNTGRLLKQISHPDVWESYRITSRFMLYWDGSSVTIVHSSSGSNTRIHGIYNFDEVSIASSGDTWYFRDSLSITLISGDSGKQLYSGDLPVDIDTFDGEFVLLSQQNDVSTLSLIDTTGTLRWEREVPTAYSSVLYYPEYNKVLLRARTNALMVDAQTGDVIMEIPVAYDPDGNNDTLTLSPAEAVLISSDAESAIYEVPAPDNPQLAETTTLRGAPSTSGVERATYPAGTEVFPTGNTQERSDGVWIELRIDEVTGWVHSDSLAGSGLTPMASPVATPLASPIATP